MQPAERDGRSPPRPSTFLPAAKIEAVVFQEALSKWLEVKSNLSGESARGDVVRPAEGRKKVVQRVFVRDVNSGQLEAPLVSVSMKQIVLAQGNVEQITGGDAGRILVIVFGIRSRHLQERRSKLRHETRVRERSERSSPLRTAKKT